MTMAIFVISHPRSGTHLMFDFLRCNFPVLHNHVHIWNSAAELFVNFDIDDGRARLQRPSLRTSHLLFKSHLGGFTTDVETDAITQLSSPQTFFIYLFRRFSSTMKRFAEFSAYPGSNTDFLEELDGYFGLDHSVWSCAHVHGQRWLARDPIFLDIDRLIAELDQAAERLAARLDLSPVPLSRRLPRRKRLFGKASEVIERLTGLESTEVQIRYRKSWLHPDKAAEVDGRFADFQGQLSIRSIN